MQKLLAHPRFSLFAPFAALLLLTLVGFGLWHWTAARLTERLAAQGLAWRALETNGFPARITLDLQDASFGDDAARWQNRSMTLTVMPFNLRHAVIDFLGPHALQTADADLTLSHGGNLMSLVADRDGWQRGSFDVQTPRLSGTRHSRPLALSAAQATLHARRGEAGRTEAALTLRDVRLGHVSGAAAAPIARLEAVAEWPAGLAASGPQAGDRLSLQRLTVQRNGLTLVARGTVKLAADGFLAGRLDLDIVQLEALFAALEEFGLMTPQQQAQWRLLGGLGAALGGDTRDRLSLPLQFKNRRTLLGPLDLGAAPRWQ